MSFCFLMLVKRCSFLLLWQRETADFKITTPQFFPSFLFSFLSLESPSFQLREENTLLHLLLLNLIGTPFFFFSPSPPRPFPSSTS